MSKLKSILIVSLWSISNSSMGGTEKYVLDLSSGLIQKNYKVSVLMMSGGKHIINGVEFIPLALDTNIKKLDEYSIKNNFFKDFNESELDRFAQLVNDSFNFNDYDIVHFNSLLFYKIACNAKRVFTLHENPHEFKQNWGKNSFSKMQKIIHHVNKNNTWFIVPSRFYSNVFKEKFHVTITTMPHSINLEILKSSETDRSKLIKDFGLDDNRFTILFPSRLELQQKRPQLALLSLKKIEKYLPKTQVVLAGVDKQYMNNTSCLKKIMKGSSIKLFFLNFSINNMKDAYKMSDIVIIPSRYESFGYSAIESLSLKKKTVLTNIPTFQEIAIGNKYAYLSKNNTVDVVAKTILYAIKSKKKGDISGWLKKYNRNFWINKYTHFYKSII